MRLLPAPARPRPAPVLLVVVLTTVLLGLLAPSTAAARPATSPPASAGPDVFHLPTNCLGPGQGSPPAGACYLTPYKKTRPTVLVWGDSHAWMYLPGIVRAVQGRNVNLVSFVAGSCPPVLIPVTRGDHYSTKCELSNVLAMRWVAAHRHDRLKVILGSNWTGFRRAYRQLAADQLPPVSGYNAFTKLMITLSHRYTAPLFARLAKIGVPTDVMRQAATVPDAENAVTSCTVGTPPYNPYVCPLVRSRAIPEEHRTDTWLQGLMKPLAQPHRYVDTTGAYCTALVCRGRIGQVNTFYDHLHLSATRSRLLWRYFLPSIADTRSRR